MQNINPTIAPILEAFKRAAANADLDSVIGDLNDFSSYEVRRKDELFPADFMSCAEMFKGGVALGRRG